MSENYESASDYLIRSSQGKKFELTDISFVGTDDGPFGDDRYFGVPRLPLVSEDDLTLTSLSEQFGFAEKDVLKLPSSLLPANLQLTRSLSFVPAHSTSLILEGSYTFSNLLLVVTPRDPRGPFTISVYQDYTLAGWLIGEASQEVCEFLIKKFDFGTAVFPLYEIWPPDEDSKLIFNMGDYWTVEAMRLPSQILSPAKVSPRKLKWNYEPVYLNLPRNITWTGTEETLLNVLNPNVAEIFGVTDLTHIWEGSIELVPDIWDRDNQVVDVYIDDTWIGRLQDRAKELEIFEALTSFDHKIGTALNGYLFIEDGVLGASINADLRPVNRIDWNEVEEQFNP